MNTRRYWPGIVLVLFLAAGLRVTALREAPPGLSYDETVNVDQIRRILEGNLILYSTTDFGRELMFHYFATASMRMLGESVFALRVVAAMVGLVGVAATMSLAQHLFGMRAAIFAGLIQSVSFVPLYYSRVGLRAITVATVAVLMMACCVRLFTGTRHPWRWAIGTGLMMGAAWYTYPAGRALPVILLITALYAALFHRDRFRAIWKPLMLTFAVGALIASPMAYFLFSSGAEERISQLTGPIDALKAGDPMPWLTNIYEVATMFVLRGDYDYLYNIPYRPYFNILLAVPFYIGLLVLIWRWREMKSGLVLIFLAGALGLTTLSAAAPSWVQSLMSVTGVMVLTAVGIGSLQGWLSNRFRNPRYAAALPLVLLVMGLGWEGWTYFGRWVPAPEVAGFYGADVLDAAHYLEDEQIEGRIMVSATGVDYWNPWDRIGLETTVQELDPTANLSWMNLQNSLVIPTHDTPNTYLVLVHDDQPSDELLSLLVDEGIGEVETTSPYTLLAGRDIGIDHLRNEVRIFASERLVSWPDGTLFHDIPKIGEIVSFVGYRLESGTIASGDSIRLWTVWQVQNAYDEPIVVFIHLLAPDGSYVTGWDDLDVPMDTVQSGDLIVLEHIFDTPADLPASAYYRLSTGWYSPETLVRQPVSDGDTPIGDHILLGWITIR